MRSLAGAVLLLLGSAATASAQIDPSRPIRLIVGYTPGGSIDLTARAVADGIHERLGVPVVVENRPGAGGTIASELVARAAPDGHTLVMGGAGTHGVTPVVRHNLPFNAERDFTAIARVAEFANAMVVSADTPIRSVQEFITYVRARPGQINFGSQGVGTSIHLAGELFNLRTGVDMTHVPYRGSASALTDLRGGRLHVMFDNLPSVYGQIEQGALRALAVTSAERAPGLPAVPTMAEAGVPDFVVTSWIGPFGPAGMSKRVVDQLSRAFAEAATSPDGREKLRAIGATPAPLDAAAFDAVWRQDIKRWREVVSAANIQVEE
jgi:tripartite-type tricarboxylate transporter receptor subunit TctC